MNVTLVKKWGAYPKDFELTVTNDFGRKLIADGTAVETKAVKTKAKKSKQKKIQEEDKGN